MTLKELAGRRNRLLSEIRSARGVAGRDAGLIDRLARDLSETERELGAALRRGRQIEVATAPQPVVSASHSGGDHH